MDRYDESSFCLCLMLGVIKAGNMGTERNTKPNYVRLNETILSVGHRKVAVSFAHILGYAFLTSWFTVMVWNSNLGYPTMDSYLIRSFFIFGTALGMLIPAIPRNLENRKEDEARSIGEIIVIVCLSPWASLSLIFNFPLVAICILWFVSGIANARLLIIWSRKLTSLSQKSLIVVFSGSFIVAGLMLLLTVYMDAPLRYEFAIALPLLSTILALITPSIKHKQKEDSSYRSMVKEHPDGDAYYKRERLLSMLINLVIGFLISCAASNIFPYASTAIAIGLAASGILITILLFKVDHSLSYEAFGLLLPCATVLFLIFCFATSPMVMTIALALLIFVFSAFSILNISKLAWCSRFITKSRKSDFVVSRSASRFTFLAGYLIGFGAIALGDIYPPALILASFILLAAVSLTAFNRFYSIRTEGRKRDRDPEAEIMRSESDHPSAISTANGDTAFDARMNSEDGQSIDSKELSIEDAIERLREDMPLSPRELEIATLLAKGRNAQYIATALYISTNTVKTHMQNLYGKLDVHSQQELIDMVEDYRKSKSN